MGKDFLPRGSGKYSVNTSYLVLIMKLLISLSNDNMHLR